MKEWLFLITEHAIALIDLIALAIILVGTIEAAFHAIPAVFRGFDGPRRREIWLNYARWLVAGLTFQLAADIIETSITTEWDAVGRLAAIAVIRTFLNYFLERDLAETRERQRETASG